MKKLLLSLLCVFALAAATAHAETKTYELCTDEAEILNPDNQFLVVMGKPYKNKVFALSNEGVTSNSIVSKVIDNSSIVATSFQLDVTTQGLGLFSLKNYGEYKALYDNVSGKYFGCSTGNITAVQSLTDNNKNYQLSVTMDASGFVTMIPQNTVNNSDANKTRAFFFQGLTSSNVEKANFKNYLLSNKSTGDYGMPLFYKEVQKGPSTPQYNGFEQEYEIVIGETKSLPSITPGELTYTFTTEDTDVIEIDQTAKTFKGLKGGDATVKFSTDAKGDFLAGEGEFTVHVLGKTPEMRFRDQVVYGKVDVGVVWEPVIVEDPADADLRGDITYSSSDPDVVSVDEATGQTEVKAAGRAIITATMAAKGDYAAGSASYTIIVVDPNSAEIETNISDFDFTVPGAYGLTIFQGSTSTMEPNVAEIPGPYGVVSISFDDAINGKPKHRQYLKSGNYELRVSKGGVFTILVPEDYRISKIGIVGNYFNATTTNPANGASTEITDWGDNDPTGENESFSYDWVPATDDAVHSVQFTMAGGSAVETAQISKIYVLYEGANSNLKSANLSFTKVINNAYEGDITRFNAVNNPNKLPISYKIENLDSEEYTITPTEDGKYIDVKINKPGYYSLQATSEPDETYRSGFAIMRVNVYHHLDMTVDGEAHYFGTPINTTAADDAEVFITVPELTTLYYKIMDQSGNSIDTYADANDEDCEAGFTPYEDGIYIPAGTRGTLVFYIAAYGYKSPKRYVPLGSASVEGFEHMVHAYGKTARMYYTIYINDHDDEEEYTVTLKVDNKPFTSTDHEISVVEAPQGAMLRKSPTSPTTHKATGYIDATGINETNAKKTHTYEITVAHNGATLSDHTATGTFITDGTTGIEDVAVDSAEAAPEYFNLQGVRVAEPQAGNIYIVRRGNKVTKELIK